MTEPYANMINDGGPAFPVWELNGQGKPEMTGFGMSIRDYFAAKALPAVYKDFWDDVRAGRHGSAPEDWTMGVGQCLCTGRRHAPRTGGEQ